MESLLKEFNNKIKPSDHNYTRWMIDSRGNESWINRRNLLEDIDFSQTLNRFTTTCEAKKCRCLGLSLPKKYYFSSGMNHPQGFKKGKFN